MDTEAPIPQQQGCTSLSVVPEGWQGKPRFPQADRSCLNYALDPPHSPTPARTFAPACSDWSLLISRSQTLFGNMYPLLFVWQLHFRCSKHRELRQTYLFKSALFSFFWPNLLWFPPCVCPHPAIWLCVLGALKATLARPGHHHIIVFMGICFVFPKYPMVRDLCIQQLLGRGQVTVMPERSLHRSYSQSCHPAPSLCTDQYQGCLHGNSGFGQWLLECEAIQDG